jgi:heme exporter protein C
VLTPLNVITIIAMLAITAMVFLFAPRELTMGEVQRIFYFHVPSAWIGFVSFAITVIAGIAYLRTGHQFWDTLGACCVEIGLAFSLMTVVSGSIWAYPAWNTWWTWDPRLTTYTIMILLYIAYMMLRQGVDNPEQRARFSSVYGIVAFVSVPITFFAIRIWRTIHPVVIGGVSSDSATGSFAMTTNMLITFLSSNLVFMLLYVCLLLNRLRLAQLQDKVERLKAFVLSTH